MSLAVSKPIEIATVANGNPFIQPSPVSGRIVDGRLPNPGFYFPDELEIQFRAVGGSATVSGPLELDCWILDVLNDVEVVLSVLTITTGDVVADDKIPPIQLPGGTRAVSLRSGNVVGTGSARAEVIWRNKT